MNNTINLFELARQELIRSNADRRHPFRYFTFGTIDTATNTPQLRTVVKRHFNSDFEVFFFTDTRSPKVAQIQLNQNVSAHFYHPKKQLQIRLRGMAELLGEADVFYQNQLNSIQQSRSISDYMTAEAPGSPLEAAEEALAVAYGTEVYFTVIRICPRLLDILQLDRNGHQRAAYSMQDGIWQEQLLVP